MTTATTPNPPQFPRLQRCLGLYTYIAVLAFTVVMLLVAFNAGLSVVFWFRGDEPGAAATKPPSFPEESMKIVYPNYTRDERDLLLRENWSRPYIYDHYVLFRERPIEGKYVHVTPAGYRHVRDQGPWPPAPTNLNVFVFGGSTTFGYGLADAETVPSFLQDALAKHAKNRRVCLYNFASGWYYSTQERLAFERLLTSGIVPHAAIFIDGLNDCYNQNDAPPFSRRFAQMFEEVNNPSLGSLARSVVAQSPMGRALRGVQRRTTQPGPEQMLQEVTDALSRYRRNKDLISALGRAMGFPTIFVWQPVPGYKYDLQYHLFMGKNDFSRLTLGYTEMAKIPRQDLGDSFLWAADLQESSKEPLYVDGNHYSPKLCQRVATFIAESILQRRLLAMHGVE